MKKSMRFGLILIFMFILSSVIHCIDFCNVPDATSWIVPTFIALCVGLLLCVLTYFISIYLNSPQLSAWTKIEISNLFSAALVAVLIYGIIMFSCNDSATLALGSTIWQEPYGEEIEVKSLFKASEDYFDGIAELSYKTMKFIRYNMGVAYVRSSISAFGTHPDSGFGTSLLQFLGGSSTSWSKFPESYVYASMFQMLLRISTLSFFNILFLKAVFAYISTGVLTIMLPFAVVMHAIPGTKSIGSALIALCVGLFVVYPAMFAVLDIYWLPYVQGDMEPAIMNPNIVNTDTPEMPAMTDYRTEVSMADILRTDVIDWCAQPEFIYTDGTTSDCNSGKTGDNECSVKIYDYMSAVGVLTLSTIFFPYLAIIVSAAFVREFSKVMGQELDITRLATMV